MGDISGISLKNSWATSNGAIYCYFTDTKCQCSEEITLFLLRKREDLMGIKHDVNRNIFFWQNDFQSKYPRRSSPKINRIIVAENSVYRWVRHYFSHSIFRLSKFSFIFVYFIYLCIFQKCILCIFIYFLHAHYCHLTCLSKKKST